MITEMKFDEIINTISFEEIERVNLSFFEKDLSRILPVVEKFGTDNEKKKITNDLQLIKEKLEHSCDAAWYNSQQYIAYFARVIAKIHPGFESELYDNNNFKKQIVKLYEDISNKNSEVSYDVLLNEFAKITATTIPDNHLSVVNSNNQKISWDGPSLIGKKDATVGNNFTHNVNNCEVLCKEILDLDFPDNSTILIAQKKVAGNIVGIIAFDTCEDDRANPTQHQKWKNILKTFNDNQESWNSVIVDVRGNGGGDNYQLKEIGQVLYGNEVPYCMEAKHRNTNEAMLQSFGFGRGEEQEKWELKEFKGKDRDVFILVDRHVGSAAEAIIPMLRPHPRAKIIGENSGGNCQFGAIRPIYMPDGSLIKIGSILRTYENGFIETKGLNPDINCSGKDAFNEALKIIETPKLSLNSIIKNMFVIGK